MIDLIRARVREMTAAKSDKGRADLVVLMHPDTRREVVEAEGFDATPDRIGGIEVEYTDDVEVGDFEVVWRD